MDDTKKFKCKSCGREIQIPPWKVQRKSCFNCWVRTKRYDTIMEANDMYLYGDYEMVLALIIPREEETLRDRFDSLKKNEDKKGLKDLYYEMRKIPSKKKKEGRRPKNKYIDKCPYCPAMIEYDRTVLNGLNCPACGRFIHKMFHRK